MLCPKLCPEGLESEPPEANASGQDVRDLARKRVIALDEVGDPGISNPPPSASRPPHRRSASITLRTHLQIWRIFLAEANF